MKVFTGSGTGGAGAAVDSATRGLTSPKAIIFFTPFDQIEEVSRLLRKQYPDAEIIGTIGTKLYNGTIDDNNTVVIGFFDDAVVQAGLIPEVSKCPIAKFAEISRNIQKVSPGHDNTVCIEFTTGNEEALVTSFQTALKKNGIPLIGGTAFGNPAGKAALVSYNGHAYEDSAVYLLIKNTAGRILTFKENIYERDESSVLHFATKVDTKARGLVELDGRPAADVYSDELGISRGKIVESVFHHPMGRVVGDKVFISSQYDLKGNGELINYKRINRGDCIYFLKLGDYPSIE